MFRIDAFELLTKNLRIQKRKKQKKVEVFEMHLMLISAMSD
jgi:hypothetical protein